MANKSFIESLVDQTKKFISMTSVISQISQEMQEGTEFVKEFDRSLTNINYSLDINTSKLSKLGKASLNTAKELKTSASNVLSGVAAYADSMDTVQTMLAKAKPAIMLSNHTGINTDTAADILQNAVSQFDLDETEKSFLHISDVFENVSQNIQFDFSKGVQEISEGIQASGIAAKNAGFDLEHYAALLGKIIENSRADGSEIGKANQTLFTRITKASAFALASGEVTDEEIMQAEKALQRVGVEVRNDQDAFRDINDIMGDLYRRLDSISQVDLSSLSYTLAETRQTSVFKALVQSWGEYLYLAKDAQNADGTTLKNQEIYADSLAGRYGELTSSAQNFYNVLLNSDSLGFLASSGAGVLDVLTAIIDKVGVLSTAIGIGLGGTISKYLSGKGLDYRKYDTAQLLQGSDKSYCYG